MSKPLLALCVLVLLRAAAPAGAEAEEESWEIALANRRLDLTTHQARQTVTMTLTNVVSRPLTSFYVAVDAALAGKVAYVGAQVKQPDS